MSKAQESVNIAIIGAGVGGLTAAITLQNKLGLFDYTIYDLAPDVGGTWRQNDYPGCACDVPAHWYSLSTDPNPDWTCLFAPQEEIFAYWKRLAHKHKIESHIQFNTELISAVWNDKEQNYTLNLRDAKTQKVRQVMAKIVISAVGVFRHPRWPDVPGRKKFQGDILHAQMWDHSISLSGKRVALIGNGCAGYVVKYVRSHDHSQSITSSSQILPVISEDHSTRVVNFCRTPSWYVPRPQRQVPEWIKWVFQHVPLVLRAFRYLIAAGTEFGYLHWRVGPITNYMRARLEKSLIEYIKRSTPEKYHEHLIPKYPAGCKRFVADPGYLDALNRPNVGMVWDPIAEITSDGIRTQSGKEHQFDVIAFATGFDVEGSLTLDIRGVNGRRLQDYYDSQGGPTGYMGTTIPGFPNWITIFGPNTATGHASVIFAEELQMDYIIQLLKPILQGKASSVMPRDEPTRAWNERIQSGLKRHVWPSCNSWYRAAGADGKIIALWPGSNSHMWWAFRKPNWSHFTFKTTDGKEWIRGTRASDFLGILAVGIGALALVKGGEWEDLVQLPKIALKQGFDLCRAILP